jgi:hypothetical protein
VDPSDLSDIVPGLDVPGATLPLPPDFGTIYASPPTNPDNTTGVLAGAGGTIPWYVYAALALVAFLVIRER